MTNEPTSQQGSTKKPHTAWFVVGIILLLIGLYWWVTYIQETINGFKTGKLDTPLIFLGFLFWLVPWFLGTFISLLAARGLRKITSLIVLPLGLIFLTVAIVSTVMGAEPPTSG